MVTEGAAFVVAAQGGACLLAVGTFLERKEEVRSVTIPTSPLSPRPSPDPVGQTSAHVSAVTGVWQQDRLSISNHHSLTTPCKGSSSNVLGQALQMFTNKSNSTTQAPSPAPGVPTVHPPVSLPVLSSVLTTMVNCLQILPIYFCCGSLG